MLIKPHSIFLLLFLSTSLQADVTATKTVNPSVIESGEWTEVTVSVGGHHVIDISCVPFDVILVIDQSGSMDSSDPDHLRITAAEAFVQIRCLT